MNRIITVGREFGSGGREFGRRLAEILGIAYYDQEIIMEIVNQTKFSEQYVRNIIEQKPAISFPIHAGRTFNMIGNTMVEQSRMVYQKQCKVIREMAEKSDCVIVGRCADYILREMRPYRIFLYAEMESKIKRCRINEPEHENLTDKELQRKIKEVDKQRARYYEFYTGQVWGVRINYDLCINSTNWTVKESAEAVARFFMDHYKE
ncbi:MAG: cytidylate kinase-like family protein [Lachnospiraceae bacterium]|nr:cytidylate kinase-like family protein [Lachnospiraceae bacterium]